MPANRATPRPEPPNSRSTDISCSLLSTPPSHLGQLTRSEVEATLKSFDSNSDGYLTSGEFRAALLRLGVPVSSSHFIAFAGAPNTPLAAAIPIFQCTEFIFAQRDAIQGVFQQLDVGCDGRIGESDLQTARERLNLKLSDADIKRLITIADSNESGGVEFDEFCTLLMSADSIHIEGVFEHWITHSLLETGEYGPPPEEEVDTPTWVHLLAGGIAGAVSRTATAPLDRLKTLLQAQGAHPAMPNTGVRVTGMWHCVQEIVREGGLKSFWRGNGTNVVKIAPETACKFWAYDSLKAWLTVDPANPTMIERLASGGLAGTAAQALIYPMEVLKTRMALAGTGDYRGMWDCARTTVAVEGPRGLYRGLTASLVGILPYSAVDLTVYSILKEVYVTHSSQEPGIGTLLLCGAVSTTCGQLCTYPLQLVRTRLQAQGMKGRPVAFTGITDCVLKTLKHDGVFGLYKGIIPNFMKSLPAISLSYTVYELSKRWLTTLKL